MPFWRELTMFMQHRVIRKGLNAGTMAGSAGNVFANNGLSVVAQGDDWRLGSNDSVLVLCQTMPLQGDESWVMTVAVSNDASAVAIVDVINQGLIGTHGL